MYCLLEDIKGGKISEKTLIQLTSDVSNSTEINEELVKNIIAEQSKIIDDYLRGRYSLPLKNSHSTLRMACAWLVIAEIYTRRGSIPEHIKYQMEKSYEQLRNIQKGIIRLNEDDGSGYRQPSKVVYSEKESVYPTGLMENYGK